jgi:SNF2 family DNA or RNA helicase
LALIHSNICSDFNQLRISSEDVPIRIPSRATLLICPINIINQWEEEIRRCLGEDMMCNVVKIAGPSDHKKLSWKRMMDSDIILVSAKFLESAFYADLINSYYKHEYGTQTIGTRDWNNYFSVHTRSMIAQGRASFENDRGIVCFECFHFYRVIYDEFHELLEASKSHSSLRNQTFNLRANYFWGLTGTPRFNSLDDLKLAALFINARGYQNDSYTHALTFKNKYIKRNSDKITLPEYKEEVIYVDLNLTERALYHTTLESKGRSAAFMLCSHYQIGNVVVEGEEGGNDKVMTTRQVAERLFKRLEREKKEAKAELKAAQIRITKYEKRLAHIDSYISGHTSIPPEHSETEEYNPVVQNNMERLKCKITLRISTGAAEVLRRDEKLKSKLREFNHLKELLTNLGKDQLTGCCVICMEELSHKNNLVATECAHILCGDCFADFKKRSGEKPKCPACRQFMELNRVMPFSRTKKVSKKVADADRELGWGNFGSKILVMLRTMRKIQFENADAKFIIFIQNGRLAEMIQTAFKKLDIAYVRVSGSNKSREVSIKSYKNGPANVIILSAESTLCFLIHRFC